MDRDRKGFERRSFLSRLGVGATALGAVLTGSVVPAAAQSSPSGSPDRWQPSRHAEDDWFDRGAGKHRIFFDTTAPDAFGQAIAFANNFYTANASGYGLTDADLAVIICARHQSTAFAFDEAMWTKYGAVMAERMEFKDPKTKEWPTVNVYMTTGYGRGLRNNNTSLDSLLKRGLRLAVCQMATRANATAIAGKTGGKVDDVFKELSEHLVPNAHLVPAGIVAVNRAQERGYTFAYAT